MTNLLTGNAADFTSSAPWVNALNGSNFTSAWSSTNGGEMAWTVTTGGSQIAQATHSTGSTSKIPVTAGASYALRIQARQTAGSTMRQVRVEGHFFQADQVTPLASGAFVQAATVSATGSMQTIGGTVVAPAGAAYARMRVSVLSPAASDAFAFDNAVFDNGVSPTPPSPTYQEIVSGDSPVGWWQGNGTTADEVAGGSSGTLVNGATYGAGILPSLTSNQVFFFDGVNDAVTVPDQDKLDIISDLTIEAWFRADSLPGAGVTRTIANKGTTAGQRAWGLRLNGSTVEFFQRGATAGDDRAIGTAVSANTVYHVVGTRTSAGVMTLYVNNVSAGSVTYLGNVLANTAVFRFGSSDGTTSFFAGRIGEVAVWNRVLTTTEIGEHYTAGLTGGTPAPIPEAVVSDYWNGTSLVRLRTDRYTGSALVQQVIAADGTVSTPGLAPVTYANDTTLAISGNQYRTQNPNQTWSCKADPDPWPTYARCELRAGERWINDINQFPNDDRQRSELRNTSNLPTQTNVWFSHAIRVNQSVGWKPGGYNIIRQFHAQGRGSPSVGFSIIEGRLQIYTQGSLTGPGTTDTHPNNVTHYSGLLSQNEWHRIVGRVVFSQATPNGQLEVWLDGVRVINATGLVNGYNGTAPYEKFGIYRSGWTGTIVVEHANNECGTTDLSGRVSAPLPLPEV